MIDKENIDDICLYCRNNNNYTLWVQCNRCLQWVHVKCIPLKYINSTKYPTRSHQIDTFVCSNHEDPLLNVKKSLKRPLKSQYSLRKRKQLDYIALNEGHDIVLKEEHPHMNAFQRLFEKLKCDKNVILSSDFKQDFNDIKIPLRILDPENSGMHVPTYQELFPNSEEERTITVDDLTRVIGEDYVINVMDVQSQQNDRWTMKKWNDYYSHTPVNERDRVRNVISLEVSHVPEFIDCLRRPEVVEMNDLVDIVWEDKYNRPKVTKYILMSVINAYTDFHLDFAGTSVYYNIIYGKKKFILFPPTSYNLTKYREWCDNDNQQHIFLGDLLKDGIAMQLKKGDLFMIPCGYIHAVCTFEDSLIVGGNFLTLRDLDTQLKVVNIEQVTGVSKKFTFPNFDQVMGKTCEWLLRDDNNLFMVDKDRLMCLISFMKDPKTKYRPKSYHGKKEMIQKLTEKYHLMKIKEDICQNNN